MAAATEYGIPHVAESLDALVTDPLVDQVLVLTTSQQHEKGIRAAITAGKDVYCEWPLTRLRPNLPSWRRSQMLPE